jgi:hypothetical protein
LSDTLVDKIVAETGYERCVVSVLVALSAPLRSTLIAFLNTARAALLAEKAKLVGLAANADVISVQLGIVANAGRAALAPFDTLLGALPFQQMGASCNVFVGEFQQMLDSTPTELPPGTAALASATGFDGFDLFANVKDYHSMRNKMDELAFRMQRATSVSDKVNKLSTDADRALDIIDKYLNIFTRMQ